MFKITAFHKKIIIATVKHVMVKAASMIHSLVSAPDRAVNLLFMQGQVA